MINSLTNLGKNQGITLHNNQLPQLPVGYKAAWFPNGNMSVLSDISGNLNNAAMSNCASGYGRALTFNGINTVGTVADSESVNINWTAQCFWSSGLAALVATNGGIPQGLACDGTYWYITGSNTAATSWYIVKVAVSNPNTIVAQNLAPLNHDVNLTHIGECCVNGNYLYVTSFSGTKTCTLQQVIKYNLSDLSFVSSIDISAIFTSTYPTYGIDGIAIDSDDTMYVHIGPNVSPYTTNKILSFDLSGNYLATITLSESLAINGLVLSADELYFYTTKDSSNEGPIFRKSDGQRSGSWTTELGLSGENHAQGLELYNGAVYNLRRLPSNHIRKYSLNSSQNGLTLVHWVKPAVINVNQSFIRRYDFANNKRVWGFILRNNNTFSLEYGTNGGATGNNFTAKFGCSVNTWQMVCGTYDGLQFKIWKRNVDAASFTTEVSNTTTFFPLLNIAQNVYLGDDPSRTTPFNGQFGLSALWARTLSATEIETLFQNTKRYYA